MKPRAELEKEYFALARRADARLRKIEEVSHRPEYQGIKEFAYQAAIDDIQKRFGRKGQKRFGTGKSALPKTSRKLQAKINAINKFLESPSSTATGVRGIYKERAEFFNKHYGTNFNWKSLAKLFENDRFDKLQEIIQGSGETLNIVGVIQRNKRKIKQAIKKADTRTIDLVDEYGNPVDAITLKDVQDVLNDEDGKEIIKALLS